MGSKEVGIVSKSFSQELSSFFHHLYLEHCFADVTLVTNDQTLFQAHKMVLSSCSPFLKSVLQDNSSPQPTLYFSDISKDDMQCILQYMYYGKTKLKGDNIDRVLEHFGHLYIKEFTVILVENDRDVNSQISECAIDKHSLNFLQIY